MVLVWASRSTYRTSATLVVPTLLLPTNCEKGEFTLSWCKTAWNENELLFLTRREAAGATDCMAVEFSLLLNCGCLLLTRFIRMCLGKPLCVLGHGTVMTQVGFEQAHNEASTYQESQLQRKWTARDETEDSVRYWLHLSFCK